MVEAVVFVPIQPCRVVDTRGGGVFTGAYGPPVMSAGQTRTFDLNSAPHCPGIPALPYGYSLNFTVTQTAGAPGDIRAWPTNAPPTQLTSILNWTTPGATLANAIVLPGGLGGAIDVQVAGSATHLLIDVNGYFTSVGNPESPFNRFTMFGERADGAILSIRNDSQDCSGDCGLDVFTLGQIVTAIRGHASSGNRAYGVHGSIGSITPFVLDSAGVRGTTGASGFVTDYHGGYSNAGVRGQGAVNGVLGIANVAGAVGDLVTPSAPFQILTRGILGYDAGATDYAVWGQGPLAVTGTKSFVEPHPTDASKVIRYVSLEGPEAGTYFRGRGKFERGTARIAVPEDFRMVTDEEGLSVQVTPIGGMASVGVMKVDLNEIVVQSSRNLEFYYLVQGVRRTHKHLTPIVEGDEYRPERRDSTMPAWLTEGQRQLLIQNGTYRPDGTVNMETAQRLGWDRDWAEREGPRTEPTPE